MGSLSLGSPNHSSSFGSILYWLSFRAVGLHIGGCVDYIVVKWINETCGVLIVFFLPSVGNDGGG